MKQQIEDFTKYLLEVKQSSMNTIRAYRNDLSKLESFLRKQGIENAAKITETSLNSYVLSLEKENMSPSSVSRHIASMKAFLLYLLKNGSIKGDPSERIKPPKVVKKSPQVLEEDKILAILNQPNIKTSKGIRDKAMLELLYATGMKVSELVNLKLSDVNLSGKYVTCGDKNERSIPFGNASKDALNAYLKIRNAAFDKKNNEYLFLNSHGEQLSRQGFWKILKEYSKKAGIEGINPNMIRHSFAAHMIDNGADIGVVQKFLGHTDISTTQLYLSYNYQNSREVYANTHPRA
ncbi:MAG TPA: tyrosine recombinase [Clostridiales bacterium]|jgi:integrase/recombinase XerD|nr:tyrosine recombinase [Clostridiales bacterium]